MKQTDKMIHALSQTLVNSTRKLEDEVEFALEYTLYWGRGEFTPEEKQAVLEAIAERTANLIGDLRELLVTHLKEKGVEIEA